MTVTTKSLKHASICNIPVPHIPISSPHPVLSWVLVLKGDRHTPVPGESGGSNNIKSGGEDRVGEGVKVVPARAWLIPLDPPHPSDLH